MVCLLDTKTSQLEMLRVFDTEQEILGIRIYTIITKRHSNGKVTHRFGTWEQVKIMLRPYKVAVKDKETLDKLLNETRFSL